MNKFPHRCVGPETSTDGAPVFLWECRCGAAPGLYSAEIAHFGWGDDCPVSMRYALDAYRDGLVRIGAMLATPGAEDMADRLGVRDIDTLVELVGGIATRTAARIAATLRTRAAERRATADRMSADGEHADATRYYTYAAAEECCAVLVERGEAQPKDAIDAEDAARPGAPG